ncbi:uncharacterized protein LOC124156397 [Ischnura elegans]|uniref:uncharacterized protein LOC124156397 n=1 Tax=Ischnura elegans TaxID=197161 RepID=UPI001ED8672B|nr:uncharacterized protein LOC124156397 [Ischnura elegans]
MHNTKMQTMDVDMTSASGEETFGGEIVQSVAEISKSPPPFKETIKFCDSFKFDRCHTSSISSSKTELEQFPEPQEEIRTSKRNTNLSPSAESLASEREKASPTSQCPYCPATNLDPQLAACIMDLKNYNEYKSRMETLTLEKAELERLSVEANLHHNKLRVDVLQIEKKNAELQNQTLTLERKQLEQKIAQQKEMHLMKLKMINLKMEMANCQDENSLYDDSNYTLVMVEPSRQVRYTSDVKGEKTIEDRYVYFQIPTSIGQ